MEHKLGQIGNKYEGAWQDNKRNRHGKYTLANGNKYVGEWKDNKRNGHGTNYIKTYLGFKITKQGQWRNSEFIG